MLSVIPGGGQHAERTRLATLAEELRVQVESARLAQEAPRLNRAGESPRPVGEEVLPEDEDDEEAEENKLEAKALNLAASIRKKNTGKRTFVAKFGRHRWRVFHVSRRDLRREDGADASEPGWHILVLDPPPTWRILEPIGPYRTVKALLDDVVRDRMCGGYED